MLDQEIRFPWLAIQPKFLKVDFEVQKLMEHTAYTIRDLLSDYPPPIQNIAAKLQEIILATAPGTSEKANRGWRSISFRDKQVGYFCGIFPFEDHVDLIFEFGVLLPDPDGILQGDAKQVRYLRFHGVEEVREAEIKPLLLAALDLPPQHAARRGLTSSDQPGISGPKGIPPEGKDE